MIMKKTIAQILLVTILVFSLLGVFIACDKTQNKKSDEVLSAVDTPTTYVDEENDVDFILLTVYGDGYVNKYNPDVLTIYPDKTIKAQMGWDMGSAIIYTDLSRATVIIHYNK